MPGGDRDCPDTLQAQWEMTNGNANDRIYFTFKTVGAGGHASATPSTSCSARPSGRRGSTPSYNDLLIAYQVDPTPDNPNANPPVDPYSGNVTFIPDPNDPAKGLPLTITALDPYFDGHGYTYSEPQLPAPASESHACSDWFTAKGGVQPGAEITVGFFLADMSDQYLTTVGAARQLPVGLRGLHPERGRRLRRPADVMPRFFVCPRFFSFGVLGPGVWWCLWVGSWYDAGPVVS